MKILGKVILATFNTSKSGKSLIRIDGDTMIVVNSNIGEMIKRGEVEEVEFQAGADLMDQADPNKVAFKTMNVKDFTQSALSKLQNANALCAAFDGVDQDKVTKALALAAQIKF